MKYKQIKFDINNPVSIWEFFGGKEKVLFYNSITDEFIIGVNKYKDVAEIKKLDQFMYIFCQIPFFNSLKDSRWEGISGKTVAFEYYFVIKNNSVCEYYLNEPIMPKDVMVSKVHHDIKRGKECYKEWCEFFDNIQKEIGQKKVKKVVASREIEFTSTQEFNVGSILLNLLEKNRNSFIFAYYCNGKTFLGATPEVLVEKHGNIIESFALAGTISRDETNDNEKERQLLNDSKNRYEHQIVIDSIVEKIKTVTDNVKIGKTTVLQLNKLLHLKTLIQAEDETKTIVEWAKILHPTPAMGGEPSHIALEIIKNNEKHERGGYAAPIGLIDNQGNGIFVVGIRSALIMKNKLYAYAGCGIVEQSNCKEEYEEINHKLQTILDSL